MLTPEIESLQSTFRNISPKTPLLENKLEKILKQWNSIWNLSHLYVDRYVNEIYYEQYLLYKFSDSILLCQLSFPLYLFEVKCLAPKRTMIIMIILSGLLQDLHQVVFSSFLNG